MTLRAALKRHGLWVIAWGVLSLLAWYALQQTREAFETDARIANRLLSQQVVQHDAVLAALALLDANDDTAHPKQPVIVLDVRMPGIRGLTVLDLLKTRGVDQPVVMPTGHGNVDLCRRAF